MLDPQILNEYCDAAQRYLDLSFEKMKSVEFEFQVRNDKDDI